VRKIAAAWAGLALALGACTAAAQTAFPTKPVRIIVPFAPGGGTDAFARTVGAKLTQTWGQQVIVDNRAGAQGNIGTALGAKSPADGYTLTLAYVGTLAINPHLYKDPGFDALKDFAAITRGTLEAWVLVVHPSLPVRTAKELAALARQRPGQLTFASSASGTQLVGELFKIVTKTNILHVPYKGAGPAVVDLLAGNVQIMWSNPTAAVPHVKNHRLQGLMVTGNKHLEALPQLPDAIEAGFPRLDVYGWYGMVAPAGTPPAILTKLNTDFVDALNAADVRERMKATGQELSPSSVQEFQEQIRKDYALWGEVVKASGARVD
jgi:tripartite-type tricarboxylate transporter receptor subunit TctC